MRHAASFSRSSTRTTQVRSGRLRSVLVPVDLTPSSDRVLGRVALLPLAADALVTIVHVIPDSLPTLQQPAAERDASRALAIEARHLAQSLPKGVRVAPLVVRGATLKQIVACAAKTKAELIVIGRAGGRAVRDALLGSTAERVIRRAQLPVLVVRLAPRSAYRRPALALDIDDRAARDVVRHLFTLVPPPRPQVAVIHAYEVPHPGLVYPSLDGYELDETNREHQRSALRRLERLLGDTVAALHVPPEEAPSWKPHVREGAPTLLVQKVTSRAHTDLLVLGSRGYSSAAYFFLGTVSGELVREVKCDVLVVPPRERGQ